MMTQYNLAQKLIHAHLTAPAALEPGNEIAIRIDQTLTHDITAVMSYLAFEQLGLDRVKTERSVSYLDHNLLYGCCGSNGRTSGADHYAKDCARGAYGQIAPGRFSKGCCVGDVATLRR